MTLKWKQVIIAIPVLFLNTVISQADNDRYRRFDDAHLMQGRTIWLGSCEGCHGWGVGDAPVPLDYGQWEARLAKGKDTLYKHALEGFFGPDDSMMPERGGDPNLTNDEIRAAVDYMIELAISHKK